MKRKTMIKILKGLAGGRWGSRDVYLLLSQVVLLSGVPRMTTYRYLPVLIELGYAECELMEYRGGEARKYAITASGRDFAGIIG